VQGEYYRNQVVDTTVIHPIIAVAVLACQEVLQGSIKSCSVVSFARYFVISFLRNRKYATMIDEEFRDVPVVQQRMQVRCEDPRHSN
jgi:small basic protein